MSKIMWATLTSLVTLLIGILLWVMQTWVSGVNERLKIVDELHFRSIYLHGALPEAPVDPLPVKK